MLEVIVGLWSLVRLIINNFRSQDMKDYPVQLVKGVFIWEDTK